MNALFTPEAASKFSALVLRRNGLLDQPIECYLRRAEVIPPDTHKYYTLARVLGIRDLATMSVRKVYVNECTTAYFILAGDQVVEVMGHRAFTRSIERKWEYGADAAVAGKRDGERLEAAFKHKRPKRVGGGLMRGRSNPRGVKLKILSTRTLRRVPSGE